MSITVTGIQALSKAIKAAEKSVGDSVGKALREEGYSIMGKSKVQVPVDTGRLRASGYVGSPKKGFGGTYVPIGYGTDYGLTVHERMDSHHPVGKAKYLEDPVNEAKAGYADRVAKRISKYSGVK